MSLSFYRNRNLPQTPGEIGRCIMGELEQFGELEKVLILPPDISRMYSYGGQITCQLYEMLKDTAQVNIMPALGTHMPMTAEEIDFMYPGISHGCFIEHRWKDDVVKIGEVPAAFLTEISEGRINEAVDIEVNKLLLDPSYDAIISVGQVVPHEVVGMANYSKNIFVGCGGNAMLNQSHFLGAVFGMERMMGRDKTPVRALLDYAQQKLDIPLLFVLTVVAKDEDGDIQLEGLFADTQRKAFEEAVELARQTNMTMLEKPLKKVVCYLNPREFHSTWTGNKAIYRTRMAIADGGELLIIGPGVHTFGEDPENDRVIRRYGYYGTEQVMAWVNDEANEDIRNGLSVAAHLIHGSSEGRFKITYAVSKLSREEIEKAGLEYMDMDEALRKYDVHALKDGFNTVDGEEIFYISNPALGLWAYQKRFVEQS